MERHVASGRTTVALAVLASAGAVLHATKGAALLVLDVDLSLVPLMLLLFGIGILSLYRCLTRRGLAARAGMVVAVTAGSFGALAVACQVVGWQPEDPVDPVLADVAYGGGTLGILLGLLLLGVAWARDAGIDPRWRPVPLVVALVWFPPRPPTFRVAVGTRSPRGHADPPE